MSLRITFSVDPGFSGAIAVFRDGDPESVLDMPIMQVGKWKEVDAQMLADSVRLIRRMYSGASFSACIEHVGSMPTDGRTSAFRFGEGFGKVKAVFETLGIPYNLVTALAWKGRFGLIGTEKDAARVLAITRFPSMASELKRKKDGGRADSLWIGLYHEQVNQ